MPTIDLNCDMGEGIGNDSTLMPFISSANIACGYHAGDVLMITKTIDLCLQHNVAIGAHPSFNDRANFGRIEIKMTETEIYQLVTDQLLLFSKLLKEKNGLLHHVKPHGALYNLSAKDLTVAATIANAIKDLDESLILYGLAGSFSLTEAKKIGLKTASEVFADRSYQDDGSLTPRQHISALIENEEDAIKQVTEMINEQTVTALSGKHISLIAETICLHGDGKNAVSFANAIYWHLKQQHIGIQTI